MIGPAGRKNTAPHQRRYAASPMGGRVKMLARQGAGAGRQEAGRTAGGGQRKAAHEGVGGGRRGKAAGLQLEYREDELALSHLERTVRNCWLSC
jgi:hypothetical protein